MMLLRKYWFSDAQVCIRQVRIVEV
jgi:hypothetical protein